MTHVVTDACGGCKPPNCAVACTADCPREHPRWQDTTGQSASLPA